MANVSSNNLTTLYSGGGVNVRPTSAYGNANVVSLLNVGTDGGNTVTNIVATGNLTIGNITANGNVTADYFIGNFVGNATNANFANYANFANFSGNVTVSSQPNITSLGTLINVSATGNITSVSGVFVGNGAGLTNINGANVNTVANANFAAFAGNVTNSAQPNITSLGTLVNVSVTGNITSVSGVFVGNGAGLTNINGANITGNVANANYAAYAGNVTIAGQSNITSLGTLTGLSSNGIVDFANAANVNLGSNSNVHIGGGAANYALITDGAGNLSWGQVANALVANFANFAGNVTNSAQPNITSVGTLSNLSVSGNITSGNANLGNLAIANFFSGDGGLLSNITIAAGSQIINGNSNVTVLANSNVTFNVNGVANTMVVSSTGANIIGLNVNSGNVALPVSQIQPTGVVVGTTANANLEANSFVVVADYGNGQGDGNSALTKSTSYVKLRGDSATPTTAVANDIIKRENYLAYNATGNVLYSSVTANATTINANANAVWGSGAYQINTGSTTGDLGNANALSAYNSLNFLSTGQLQIIPGANSAPGSMLQIVSYGQPASIGQSQGITFSKARGNRDANASVQANDTIGRIVFQAHNGNAFVVNRLPIIRSVVDSSYTTGNANIPAGIVMAVCDSNTNYSHNFYANGATTLSGNLNVVGGNLFITKTTAGATSLNMTGDKTTNSTFSLSETQFSVTMSNIDTTGGYSPFRFQQYAPTNNQFGAMYMYRARGDSFATQTPAGVGDEVLRIVPAINSNNAFASIGYFSSRVSYNDNAGNTAGNTTVSAVGSGTTGYLNSIINLDAHTTSANNFTANNISVSGNGNITTGNITTGTITTGNIGNLQLNQFQEDVYAIGSTSGTITPDFNNGSIQTMTLTGSITMNSLANAVTGRSMVLVITQGGIGGYTLTSSMLFSNGYKILSSGVGAVDIISIFYSGSTYYASLTNGYA